MLPSLEMISFDEGPVAAQGTSGVLVAFTGVLTLLSLALAGIRNLRSHGGRGKPGDSDRNGVADLCEGLQSPLPRARRFRSLLGLALVHGIVAFARRAGGSSPHE